MARWPVGVNPSLWFIDMSFKVNLFTLSKRDNSTKQPTGTGTEYNCILKDGCGILHPTIKLDLGLTSDPSDYNYAYIPAFGRYYFIEEWYFVNRLWVASLNVDVLATYKSNIGSANLYVLRAAGAHNGNIIDTLYPAKTGCSFASDTKSNPWNTSGLFVVGIVTAAAAFGSMDYFAMSAGELATMCGDLTDPTTIISAGNDFDLMDASAGLQLSLVDPIQYIKTCVWLPVAEADITNLGTSQTLTVYRWNTSTGNKIYPTSRINKSYSFTIQNHPDTSSRGNYVNSKPFTNITLTMPPFGCIDIDSSVTCNASTLGVEVELDPITGKGILVVTCNGIVLNRLEAQIGVPISLSSVTRDYIGAASSALGAVGGLASLSAQGVLGAMQGIGNAVESLMPRANTIGTTGAFVANHGDFRLDFQFFRPVDDDNTHNGRPLCDVRQISNLSGYILVQDGDVATNGTATEDAKIRQYLETGFYYE